MSKPMRSWHLDVNVGGSDRSSADQLSHLAVLCRPQPVSGKNDVHWYCINKGSIKMKKMYAIFRNAAAGIDWLDELADIV